MIMKPNKTADLLKVLGQQTPTAAVPETKPRAPEPPPAPLPSTKNKRQNSSSTPKPATGLRGRGVHLWFHEEDEKLIRELSVWLHTQRPRINDSLVIKAVLRAAKTGPALLAAYDEAVKIDGRKRPVK
jgi:hypothetical protein